MGWWYEPRGSNGGLVMFGTSYSTEEAATRAAETTKGRMCKHRADVRFKNWLYVSQIGQRHSPRPSVKRYRRKTIDSRLIAPSSTASPTPVTASPSPSRPRPPPP